MMRRVLFLIPTFAMIVAASVAKAQDENLGKTIFEERCAVCHGISGSGDGMVGELFAVRPKDLKLLSRENDGEFPFVHVYQSIDGRTDIAAHGPSEMPVWGEYFMREAIANPSISDLDAWFITEGRILSLVYYLQTLQVD